MSDLDNLIGFRPMGYPRDHFSLERVHSFLKNTTYTKEELTEAIRAEVPSAYRESRMYRGAGVQLKRLAWLQYYLEDLDGSSPQEVWNIISELRLREMDARPSNREGA